MNRSKNIILSCFAAIFSIRNVSGQSFYSANAPVTIVIPTEMSMVSNLNFGHIPVSGQNEAVTINPNGKNSFSKGTTTAAIIPDLKCADFNITGLGDYILGISLPRKAVLSDGADHVIIICCFTSNPEGNAIIGSQGLCRIRVGATVSIPAGMPASNYSNVAELPVMVDYN
jgi:Domain of unknown function (DUF4402)